MNRMGNRTANRGKGPKHTTRSAFGGKIRSLRLAKGWSQWDLALQVGVHVSYIGKIECETGRGPGQALILRLAEALDVDRDELLHLAGKSDERMVELQQKLREAQEENQRLKRQLEQRGREGKAG